MRDDGWAHDRLALGSVIQSYRTSVLSLFRFLLVPFSISGIFPTSSFFDNPNLSDAKWSVG